MRLTLPLVAVGLLLAGCSSSAPLARTDAAQQADLNRHLAGARVTVYFADGSWADAAYLHVAPDVTTWVDPRSGELETSPTEAVVRVEVLQRVRSGLFGGAVGAAVGAGLGAAYVLLLPKDRTPSRDYNRPPLVTGGALSGGVIGGIVGAVRGRRVIHLDPVP